MNQIIALGFILLSLASCIHTLPSRSEANSENCVHRADVRRINVRDARTIDFHLRDGSTRRNILPKACGNLFIVGSFKPVTVHAEYCPGDEILVPNVSHGSGELDGMVCNLGSFVPADDNR